MGKHYSDFKLAHNVAKQYARQDGIHTNIEHKLYMDTIRGCFSKMCSSEKFSFDKLLILMCQFFVAIHLNLETNLRYLF